MSPPRLHRALFVLLCLLLAASTPYAFATAERTFVASNGSDANTASNCSITMPCRGFASAIGVTNAKGEVIVLDSANYGPVTISRSVSIIAPAGVYAGVSVSIGDGITVDGSGITVILRGLMVNGHGGAKGIVFTQGATLHLENCVVSGMAGEGLISTAAGSHLLVSDTLIRENGGGGVNLTNGMLASFDRVQIKQNIGRGLYARDGPIVSIKDSTISNNTWDGAVATSTVSGYTKLLIHNSQIVFNGGDGAAALANTDPGAYALLTVEGSNLSNNSESGIHGGIQAFGGIVWMVARSNIIDNNRDGISEGLSSLDGQIIGIITDNVIHDNVNFGIDVKGSASRMTLGGNIITRNRFAGINITFGAIVQTLVNNTVTYNNPDVVGTLTTLTPR